MHGQAQGATGHQGLEGHGSAAGGAVGGPSADPVPSRTSPPQAVSPAPGSSGTVPRAGRVTGPGPYRDDDEAVTLWGLVIEGYETTQERLLGEIADRFGLAPAQFDILLRLVRSPEQRLPMTRLAREAALTSGGFTKVADRMVEADLIRRERCDTDRRVVFAALTGHGRRVAEGARAACAEIVREAVIAPLGVADAEHLAEAMRILREINGHRERQR